MGISCNIGGELVLKGKQLFAIINGAQKAVQFLYAVIILLAGFSVVNNYMQGTEDWIKPLISGLSTAELFFIVVFFGIKICKQLFSKVDGVLLGSEVSNILAYWDWLEGKIKDILVYNGALAFIMISFYL